VVYLSTVHDILKLKTIKARRDEGQRGLRSKPKAKSFRSPMRLKRDRRLSETFTADRPAPADDPQKYQWGGRSSANGRSISGAVKRLDREWFQIDLKVRSQPHTRPLTSPVTFHLHDTFDEPERVVEPRNGVASLRLVAYGAFTVGVEADHGKTRLELDLSEIKSAPRGFRES